MVTSSVSVLSQLYLTAESGNQLYSMLKAKANISSMAACLYDKVKSGSRRYSIQIFPFANISE
jgi:hypothetical protein